MYIVFKKTIIIIGIKMIKLFIFVLLCTFMCVQSKMYDFVEIGTSDFDTLLQSAYPGEIGLSIDPLQYYLDRLPSKPDVEKITAAISSVDGTIKVYYVPLEHIQEHDLPDWVRGCNSVGDFHPTVSKVLQDRGLSTQLIQHIHVPTLSVKSLYEQKQIEGIKYLKIDTEGHDIIILRGFFEHCKLHPDLFPLKIRFESNILIPSKDVDEILALYFSVGYTLISRDGDTVISKV
jgi:FkbM family methyltransferase